MLHQSLQPTEISNMVVIDAISTTHATLVPPPGGALSEYHHEVRSNVQPKSIPSGFLHAMAVREEVLVDEQSCSLENEVDDMDAASWHWVIYSQDSGKSIPVATLRLVPPPHPPLHGPSPKQPKEPYVVLGRLATLKQFRGQGLAKKIVTTALDWTVSHAGDVVPPGLNGSGWKGLVLIHAQTGTAEKAWGKMGFVKDEGMGTWIEEGIDHIGMWRRVACED